MFGRVHRLIDGNVHISAVVLLDGLRPLISKRYLYVVGEAQTESDASALLINGIFFRSDIDALVAVVLVTFEHEVKSDEVFGLEKSELDADLAYRFDVTRIIHGFAADGGKNAEESRGAYTDHEAFGTNEKVDVSGDLGSAFGELTENGEGIEALVALVAGKARVGRRAFGAFFGRGAVGAVEEVAFGIGHSVDGENVVEDEVVHVVDTYGLDIEALRIEI